MVLAATSPSAAQAPPPSALDALIPDLVSKIAFAIPAGMRLGITVGDDDRAEDAPALQMRVATLLAARGFTIADGTSAATTVMIGCGRNLRERVCVARIRSDGREQIATVTRSLAASATEPLPPVLALELRPLVSQQTQILDAAVVSGRLFVLDVTAVTLFEQKEGAWRVLQSRPLQPPPAWPRDPRGQIRVEGDRLDLFLPGTSCTGRAGSLEISCVERQQAWPIGVDNNGLEPGRNYFRASSGAVFFNSAPLGASATDDAIGLSAACAEGSYVVAVSPSARGDAGDLLRLSRVVDGRLVQAGSPLVLPGVLTALWAQDDHTSAVVVTHDVIARRYDAFDASISCSR